MQLTKKQQHKKERKRTAIIIIFSILMVCVSIIATFSSILIIGGLGVACTILGIITIITLCRELASHHRSVITARRAEYNERTTELAEGAIVIDNEHCERFQLLTTFSKTAQKPNKIYLRTEMFTRNYHFSDLKDIRIMDYLVPESVGAHQLLYVGPQTKLTGQKYETLAVTALRSLLPKADEIRVQILSLRGCPHWTSTREATCPHWVPSTH